MSDFPDNTSDRSTPAAAGDDLRDSMLTCIDCHEDFVWTAGEQKFFYDKGLQNPPKRCKACKRAKNKRIEAVLDAASKGKRVKSIVTVQCSDCGEKTTVPFYPSQQRPVYCRACFEKRKHRSMAEGG